MERPLAMEIHYRILNYRSPGKGEDVRVGRGEVLFRFRFRLSSGRVEIDAAEKDAFR